MQDSYLFYSQDRLAKTTNFKNLESKTDKDRLTLMREESLDKANLNALNRRYFDPERLHRLSKPRVLPKLFVRKTKGRILGQNKFNINTYLNTELPCKDEGKQIIYNTVKAAIYGINIREIPSMERKIESYIAPDKKTKKLVINSLCFNQQYTNREKTKNIKIKSTGLLPWGKLPKDS